VIPPSTPFKVLKYLVKISGEKSSPKKYVSDSLILHFIERKYLKTPKESHRRFYKSSSFEEPFTNKIFPAFRKYDLFIKKHQIENLENHYSVQEFDALILIEKNKEEILDADYSFQTILTQYFGSSKHRKADGILSDAIKKILKVDSFPEESKDQQFLSVLYPKNETCYIILCENLNRLKMPRHDFIEFWYAGGKNIKQLQFIPKPKFPIFYLCDWDYEGLNIYIEIKQKYLPTIKALIPDNYVSLMEKQEDVKEHHSKWKNNNCLIHLNENESEIANILIETHCIIEEQKIKLNSINLLRNGIS
jgi:hypothetical protein